ncbi:MAG: ABC transporter substrate-binding protein [Paenibacillus sp. RIFOXYA1_FULL_44_5]|nr:MAG: ABC transporter substrate-binding protein [Paenibacillus sp. RIFOXYA1_FULL_44_5]
MKPYKFTAIILMIALLMTVTAGCGSSRGSSPSASNTAQESAAPAASDSPSPSPSAAPKPLTKVTVVLDWTPNTNHTGLYVAQEKGYYKEEGLDVEIVQPGKSTAEQLVASGNAQFGVSTQEYVTRGRQEKLPIVSIAAIIQHNTSGFASPVSKNIKTPKDLEGKTYGGWGAPEEKAMIQFLMENDHGDVNKVKMLNIGETDFLTAIQRGQIDFSWIFYGWEGIEAKIHNIPLNMIFLSQYNKQLDEYTPLLITNENLIQTKPELVKAFMAATSKGYNDAIKNPEEAANLLLKAAPDLDAKLVLESQKWLSPHYQDDAARWGEQKDEVWQTFGNWMYDHKVIDQKFDPTGAFTNQFLPAQP